jgi:uncharacterized repeat protein (TIGR03803 family)
MALSADQLPAQTFDVLYSFTKLVYSSQLLPDGTTLTVRTNSDGAAPYGKLVVSGTNLYGTTTLGGSGVDGAGYGTLFTLGTDGTGFTTLHNFTSADDGNDPTGGLVLLGSALYGTAASDQLWDLTLNSGTVFSLNTDGTNFATLHQFDKVGLTSPTLSNSDGALVYSRVVLSGNTLYGTAYRGGSFGFGTIFAMNTDGTGFTNLYNFRGDTNGGNPTAALVSFGGTLYGTASGEDTSFRSRGTVFAINSDGTDFSVLHSFTAPDPQTGTNADGYDPSAGLVLSGDTLYGTTGFGGSSASGTVFALKTDGSAFRVLHTFTAQTANRNGHLTNTDGAHPESGLLLSGDTLYGTAQYGGSAGVGTVFALKTDGSSFDVLHSFSATSVLGSNGSNSDGAFPASELILSGNMLYGSATGGGSSGSGTLFSIELPVAPPQLTISSSGPTVTLTWPTNAAGFTLQSTTNLSSPIAWSPISVAPVVVNGQNTVTNPASLTQQLFRLTQ